MNEDDFVFLATLLKRCSGLALDSTRKHLVESRLTPVAARHGFKTVEALVGALAGGHEALTRAVAEAMAVCDSSFFRDREPFVRFRDTMLPSLIAARRSHRRLRIWCAGCAGGQEPYSLAMMMDGMPALARWSTDILATDINEAAIARGRQGFYTHDEIMRGLPLETLSRYFQACGNGWRIASALSDAVKFEAHNLMDSFARLGRFDVIFCRNVLLYFDAGCKRDVLKRLCDALAPDGYLVLGAAETVLGLNEQLEPFGAGGLHMKAAHPPMLRSAAMG